MTRRSSAPSSPAFEDTTRGATFHDRIAVVVKGPPDAVFQVVRADRSPTADRDAA
jgi:hypothetical protein